MKTTHRSSWAPRWPITWQRSYATARQWWLESDGRVDWAALDVETEFEGEALGRWVQAQRGAFAVLDQEQQDLLAAIGVEEDQELAAARAKVAARPNKSRSDRFAAGLAALASFVAEHGHPRVPRTHRQPLALEVGSGGDVTPFALGTWLNNTKSRRSRLTPDQLAQLAEHGVEWA
ncbi:helicase associated domain-containing protein [Kitasatospora sp. NPDC051853]|uniref:helicase associated domain-containing protein n=1 Tax=Kitasatospora sp. NPDC051853 TaxID=3364058 RepID=UPI003791DE0B